jgi:hypothetical protein
MEEIMKLASQLTMQGIDYDIVIGNAQINIEIK